MYFNDFDLGVRLQYWEGCRLSMWEGIHVTL